MFTFTSRLLHQVKCIYTRNIYRQRSTFLATNQQSDKEYLVRVQNDPDVFGPEAPGPEAVDADDLKEEKFISNERRFGKRLTSKQYADIIKALIAKQKIKEAIDVVEVRMLQEDRIRPNSYLYNLLLGACGRVGYTKKAFSLYNEMKRRGLEIHPGAYTALFNACANSPWAEDGLQRAQHLHNIIIEQRYQPNDSNYNAMIKAYGRGGDISTAFALVDEMIAQNVPLKGDTLNFLLQACISDKKAGFRHALLVWRKFYEKHIKPSVFSYNLLLRATRDCGIGDLEATKDVLKRILPENDLFLQPGVETSMRGALVESEIPGGRLKIDEIGIGAQVNRPNLLAQRPYFGDVVVLEEINKAEDRLLLLGGAGNFLAQMETHQCVPNLKTYTQLLDCLPSTMTAEQELLKTMQKKDIVADVDFLNMLMKKRSLRFDYEGAKNVLDLIKQEGHLPNLLTYGILALGCKTRPEAESFLSEMTSAKYRLNVEILGAMLQQSTFHADFGYVLFVMERCVEENIAPNAKFMEHLEKFYRKCKKISNDPESAKAKNRRFQKGFQIFRMRYKMWKKHATQEEQAHPWQQFRQPVETDVRHFQDVEKSSRFKQRHLSLFRQKQIPTELVPASDVPRWKFRQRKTNVNDTKKKIVSNSDAKLRIERR